MKKLSAAQLISVSGGVTKEIDVTLPEIHTEDKPSVSSYLPTLRDTLVFIGGGVVFLLGAWAVSAMRAEPTV